jgi:hypothetical protein
VRWEGDETGRGIGDGSAFAPDIQRLLDEMSRPDWVTEAPEAHLLPHLRTSCDSPESPFALESAELEDSIFVVRLRRKRAGSLGEIRRDVFALVGEISEPAAAIVQRETDESAEFDVTTGTVTGQTRFERGHGHLVRFVVPTA